MFGAWPLSCQGGARRLASPLRPSHNAPRSCPCASPPGTSTRCARGSTDHLARFAREAAPDVICLQETKVTDEEFPREAVRAMGYPHLLFHV